MPLSACVVLTEEKQKSCMLATTMRLGRNRQEQVCWNGDLIYGKVGLIKRFPVAKVRQM